MSNWLRVRVIATGEVVEAPRINAMRRFEDLDPDFHVWCARFDEPNRPLILKRCEIELVV
jgi:hypothetical protein